MFVSLSVCVCVFSPITQGRGKSFHFLDESLVNQKPRDLLLTALLLSFSLIYLHLFYPSSPQTFAMNSPSIYFFTSLLSVLSSPSYVNFSTSLSFKSSFYYCSGPIHFFFTACPPSISRTPTLPQPPISAVAESALPLCSVLQTHKCTDLHFNTRIHTV